jgi:hypothetical protein
MPEYIFRMPKDTPKLTFAGLMEYLGGRTTRKIGTTVTVTHYPERPDCAETVKFTLYDTDLAIMDAGGVYFVTHGDTHMATGEWLSQITQDNGLGHVFRDDWVRYLYPHDWSGDRDKRVPLEGTAFTVPAV